MKLIVNADDFGLTKGVSLGILDSIEKGVVTSTTALVNSSYFEDGMKEAKQRGIDSIGIHLAMTIGKPVLSPEQVPSLVDDNGLFHKNINNITDLNYNEVRKELKAQIERFLSFQHNPTHLDGHHHFFTLHHVLLEAVLDLANEYDLPLRCLDPKQNDLYQAKGVRTTENFIMDFYKENVRGEIIKDKINKFKQYQTVELMCHPGYVDEELMTITSYNTYRKDELDILTSQSLKTFIKDNGVELVDFRVI